MTIYFGGRFKIEKKGHFTDSLLKYDIKDAYPWSLDDFTLKEEDSSPSSAKFGSVPVKEYKKE